MLMCIRKNNNRGIFKSLLLVIFVFNSITLISMAIISLLNWVFFSFVDA